MLSSQAKLCITYICTGKYNVFFKDFYESFKDNFCKKHNLTFVILTDSPSSYTDYRDCKVYYVQRHFNVTLDFVKFRKFKDIFLAEDFLAAQDYCFYMNGNLRCNNEVTLEELFGDKDQYAVSHSLFDSKNMPMYESLTKCEKSAAYFKAWDSNLYPNYRYFQAGNFGATSKKFLQMGRFIESARYFDAYYGYDKHIKWHDETYYNKYINSLVKKDSNCIKILDGKKYLCSWLSQMKPYLASSKMLLIDKSKELT